MLEHKTVVLAVTGGIAAYKAANIVSRLVKAHASVYVIMTQNATEFISPLVMEALSGNPCYTNTRDDRLVGSSVHIDLASKADLFVVAPATANFLGKAAHGIADDIVSTCLLAMTCPCLVAPAMNTHMYENVAVQDNLKILRNRGIEIVPPAVGRLACGTVGAGKLADEDDILEYIYRFLACEKDLAGKRILINAGPTHEALDPVRYITNHSTGKMGFALARAAMLRGAQVTIVHGPVSCSPVRFCEMVPVTSASEMFTEMTQRYADFDAVIMAAAVADFTVRCPAAEKIKKDTLSAGNGSSESLQLSLERTDDIAQWLGEHRREGQRLCGFSMETSQLLELAQTKLKRKNLDMIAANSLCEEGAGFGVDTNHLTLVTYTGEVIDVPLTSKLEAAHRLLSYLFDLPCRQN